MRSTHTQLYIHMIWGTWDRLPLITTEIEPRLFAAIMEKCKELSCEPLAIGGIGDHVHLLVRLHPTVAVAELVKGVKGSSSHFVTHEVMPDQFFKWQGSYSAYTLRKSEVPHLTAYIQDQKKHLQQATIIPEWEASMSDDETD